MGVIVLCSTGIAVIILISAKISEYLKNRENEKPKNREKIIPNYLTQDKLDMFVKTTLILLKYGFEVILKYNPCEDVFFIEERILDIGYIQEEIAIMDKESKITTCKIIKKVFKDLNVRFTNPKKDSVLYGYFGLIEQLKDKLHFDISSYEKYNSNSVNIRDGRIIVEYYSKYYELKNMSELIRYLYKEIETEYNKKTYEYEEKKKKEIIENERKKRLELEKQEKISYINDVINSFLEV